MFTEEQAEILALRMVLSLGIQTEASDWMSQRTEYLVYDAQLAVEDDNVEKLSSITVDLKKSIIEDSMVYESR